MCVYLFEILFIACLSNDVAHNKKIIMIERDARCDDYPDSQTTPINCYYCVPVGLYFAFCFIYVVGTVLISIIIANVDERNKKKNKNEVESSVVTFLCLNNTQHNVNKQNTMQLYKLHIHETIRCAICLYAATVARSQSPCRFFFTFIPFVCRAKVCGNYQFENETLLLGRF